MITIRATTEINLTITIDGSTYGPEWSLNKIFEQASNEAIQSIRNNLKFAGYTIDEVKVKAIITERKI